MMPRCLPFSSRRLCAWSSASSTWITMNILIQVLDALDHAHNLRDEKGKHVAMNDAEVLALLVAQIVRVVERIEHLDQDVHRDRKRDESDRRVALARELIQRGPVHELHRHE